MKKMCECGTCPRCKSRERTRSARTAKRNMASAKQKPLEFERIRLTLSRWTSSGRTASLMAQGMVNCNTAL